MSRSRRERARWRPDTRWRHAQPPGSYDAIDHPELRRYVGTDIDAQSGEPQGIFQIMARTLEARLLRHADHALLSAMRRWFSANLARPRRFSHHRLDCKRSTARPWTRTPIAISWFKPQARVHLSRIETCARLLRGAGVEIRLIVCRRPGYITYEDQHQVVAVPFGRETDARPATPAS